MTDSSQDGKNRDINSEDYKQLYDNYIKYIRDRSSSPALKAIQDDPCVIAVGAGGPKSREEFYREFDALPEENQRRLMGFYKLGYEELRQSFGLPFARRVIRTLGDEIAKRSSMGR